MAVRIVGVEMIDRHPVEARVEVALHPGHQVAHEGFEVVELGPVLWRDDEAELVAVAVAAFQELLAIGLVACRVIELAGLAVARDAIALDVFEVRLRGSDALVPELDQPRLDDDATPAGDPPTSHRRARAPSAAPPNPRSTERQAAATSEPRPGETGRMQHPLQIGLRLPVAPGADLPELRFEAIFVVSGHEGEISAHSDGNKLTS